MKKCKLCKQLNVREFNGIAQSKYCVTCREIKKDGKKAKHRLTKGFLEREYKLLHKKAWKAWSLYVRTLEANTDGINYCYTCEQPFHYKNLQAGHFHHGKLDFDNRNIRPQCERCNKWLHGNGAIYGTKLTKELGVEGMQKLLLDSNTVKYNKEDLEDIIDKYKFI